MLVKSLRFNPLLYICELGYVYKIQNRNEVKLPIYRKKNKPPYLLYDGVKYDLFSLMVEAFIGHLKWSDTVRYTVNKFNEIPLNSIIVKPFTGKFSLSEEDEKLLMKYRCDIKSWSANSRSQQMITPVQVYTSLKIHSFRCYYCNKLLHPHNWHLDHFIPLSLGGKNMFENILPACKKCNLMKGSIEPKQFILQCSKIASCVIVEPSGVKKIKFGQIVPMAFILNDSLTNG